MATLFQRPLLSCALGLSGGAAAYGFLSHQQTRGRPLRMDSSPNPLSSSSSSSSSTSPKDWSFSQYQRDAQAPVVDNRGGLNAKAVRQMTLGSILGLASGLTISLFSKPLALLLGLAFLGLHTAEKQLNMRIIPYDGLQKYVKGIDLRGAVQDNAAMKISFGVMFALSGFASF